jgi:4-hydroxybenzoate polyprenyltransferase
MTPYTFTISFWAFAFLASAFLGYFCYEIHVVTEEKGKIPWQRRWQQYWFNFIGSLSGWIAIWFVVQKLWASNLGQGRLADFGLAVVGFIGITGYLPYTVIGVINAVWELAKKVIERAVDIATKG